MQQPRQARWWYYLPHVWESESTTWEDVYLLPDHPDWERGSLWLTVDAAGSPAPEDDERDELAAKFGEADFHLDRERLDMIVRAERFTKAELLGWVRIALAELGLPCDELVEGELALFAGSNQHARMVEEAVRRAAGQEQSDERDHGAGPGAAPDRDGR